MQVDNILEALRLNGLDLQSGNKNNNINPNMIEPKTLKLPGGYALYAPQDVNRAYYGHQLPPQELQATPSSPQELPNDSAYTPEMAGDRIHPVEMESGRA